MKIKKYNPELDEKRWRIIFLRKKMVGFVILDVKNNIDTALIAENYRKRIMAPEALKFVLKICAVLVNLKYIY